MSTVHVHADDEMANYMRLKTLSIEDIHGKARVEPLTSKSGIC